MNYYNLIVLCLISLFTLQNKQFVDFKADEVKVFKSKENLNIILPFQILEPFHIQTEKIVDNNLIPTEIHFEIPDGYQILGYEFSKANREILMLDQLKCEVLSHDLEVTVKLKIKEKVKAANNLKGYLYYQACDDKQCFYPRTLHFNVNF